LTLNEQQLSETPHINDSFRPGTPNSREMNTQEYADMTTEHPPSSQILFEKEYLAKNGDSGHQILTLNPSFESNRVIMREKMSSLLGCNSIQETARLMLDIRLNIGVLRLWTIESKLICNFLHRKFDK
jgi:hypothetical protein